MGITPISETTRLAVKNGAYWLDTAYPEWTSAIDLSRLDLSSGWHCVLGQVSDTEDTEWGGSGYGAVVDFLESEILYAEVLDWVVKHGFVTNGDGTTWAELTQAWIDHINERTSDGATARP